MPRLTRTVSKGVHRVVGKELREALGFRSERSFQRARQCGAISVPLYPIPGQARGVYARSDELAAYLAQPETPRRKRSRPMKT